MPGFRRLKIEKDIYWWTPTTLRVMVRFPGGKRHSKGFPLPSGYVPKVQGKKALIGGPAAEVLLAARRARQEFWERRKRVMGDLPDIEEAARQVTVSEMYDRLVERTTLRRRPATVKAYKTIRAPVEKAFGPMSLMSVRASDIERWLDLQLARVAPVSVQHYRQVMIRLFNLAIKADLYPYANPAAKTEPIPVQVKEGRRLSEEEAAAFLRACWNEKRGGYWFAFFGTLLITGLRFTEAARLQWEDFRWKDNLCIPSHQKATLRKDAVAITPEWEALLAHVQLKDEPTGLVFPSAIGGQVKYCTARDALVRIGKHAGIPTPEHLGLHAFRRTAITAAEKACAGDAMALMRFARQMDLNVTRRYLPIVSEQVRQISLKAAEKLGQKAGIIIPLEPRLKAAS